MYDTVSMPIPFALLACLVLIVAGALLATARSSRESGVLRFESAHGAQTRFNPSLSPNAPSANTSPARFLQDAAARDDSNKSADTAALTELRAEIAGMRADLSAIKACIPQTPAAAAPASISAHAMAQAELEATMAWLDTRIAALKTAQPG